MKVSKMRTNNNTDMENRKLLTSIEELADRELLDIIIKNKELSDLFEQDVTDIEMEYYAGLLRELTPGLKDFSLDVYEGARLEVGDPREFAYCADRMVQKYGADEKTEKAASSLMKLLSSNLLGYKAGQVAGMIQDRINRACECLRGLFFSIYEGEPGEEAYCYLETFRDRIAGRYFAGDGGVVYKRV